MGSTPKVSVSSPVSLDMWSEASSWHNRDTLDARTALSEHCSAAAATIFFVNVVTINANSFEAQSNNAVAIAFLRCESAAANCRCR